MCFDVEADMKKSKVGWSLSLILAALCVWAGMAKEHNFKEPGSADPARAAKMDKDVAKKLETATFALG